MRILKSIIIVNNFESKKISISSKIFFETWSDETARRKGEKTICAAVDTNRVETREGIITSSCFNLFISSSLPITIKQSKKKNKIERWSKKEEISSR